MSDDEIEFCKLWVEIENKNWISLMLNMEEICILQENHFERNRSYLNQLATM